LASTKCGTPIHAINFSAPSSDLILTKELNVVET